ncbi:MAG: hypothetical protein J6V98_01980 [Bacteroidales bacterium]|nr:hypothetical protein [Bacteroidales bacterium]
MPQRYKFFLTWQNKKYQSAPTHLRPFFGRSTEKSKERPKNDHRKGVERVVLTPAFLQLIDSRSSTVLQEKIEELLKNC